MSAVVGDLVVAARFPFGRYAATPWFRSRREHVGNVEWPPSPWRIARALLCTAHRLGGEQVPTALKLIQRLASVEPHYQLPPASEVVYAQWMPQLEFDDHPLAVARSENGHSLLHLAPDAELVISWPGVTLDDKEREQLRILLEATPFLGQSVSICELALRDAWPKWPNLAGVAVPRSVETGAALPDGERSIVRLLAPEPGVTQEQLQVSTADGVVKAMPSPPGSRWVEYVRVIPRRLGRRRDEGPRVAAVVHRLEGPLRPPVCGPAHPEAGRPGPRGKVDIEKLVSRAVGLSLTREEIALADDDLDGRAERLVIRLKRARPTWQAKELLSPANHLIGPAVDCSLRLENVEWETESRHFDGDSGSGPPEQLVVFRLESEFPPLLADAIVVCEAFRRRLLGVAGRRLGADAIPVKLSGKRPDGEDARDDHRHVHVLATSSNGRLIDRLAVYCPAGMTHADVSLIRSVTLPPLLGASIRLSPANDARFSKPAPKFLSHTPFLPVRHPKRRRGTIRDAPADQVAEELRRRALPEPINIKPLDGPWAAFRILRRAKQGAFPYLGAHGFELEFAEPIRGPIVLGRNSHFGMGLFLPADEPSPTRTEGS